MPKWLIYTFVFSFSILLLFVISLFCGSANIPAYAVIDILKGLEVEKTAWSYIVLQSRLPQAITALFTGGAIAVSGLLLQTAFRNPLADPGILGITSGANLGVALVVLMIGNSLGAVGGFDLSYSMTIVLGAFIGAAAILFVIMGFASIVRNNVMLLIIGIMVGYLTSSIISLLKFWGPSEDVHSFIIWGMGDFSGVTMDELPFYCIVVGLGLLLSILLIKPLNALLLGERYAANLGVNIKVIRFLLLLCAGLLTAITCAFCGPVAFIGLAVPHIARLLLGTSNHKVLLPMTILIGSAMALLCNLISVLPGANGMLPLNAITPILGAPVIIYVIINQKKIQYFN
jgi:iron complex transport system permease protein